MDYEQAVGIVSILNKILVDEAETTERRHHDFRSQEVDWNLAKSEGPEDFKSFRRAMKQMYANYIILLPPNELDTCSKCGRSFED